MESGGEQVLHDTVAMWQTQVDDDVDLLATVKPTAASDTSDVILRALLDRNRSTGPAIKVRSLIGQGGMAEVMLGEQTALHREVAVKRLYKTGEPAAAAALMYEAWLTAALEHPNIVPVYELAVDAKGNPVVVMRRIEGTDWSHYIGDDQKVRDSFSTPSAIEWNLRNFMQVCGAVHYAHRRGVIHRDIKPANIMIGPFGEVYLFDWGIAVPKEGKLKELLGDLRQDGLAGTPCYLAPEMLAGELDQVDTRSDVYLLGATLFEILVGTPPHPGKTLIDVLLHVEDGELEIPESVPTELQEILRKSMHRDKDERFQSAEALRNAIELHLSHRGSDSLANHAREDLTELRERISVMDGKENTDTKPLYQRFRGARFGFLAALDLWPANPRAKEGLKQAVDAMTRFELEWGSAEAAAALLAECTDPSQELVDAVESARSESRELREETEKLAEHSRSLLPTAGMQARRTVMVMVGLIYGAKSWFVPADTRWLHLSANVVIIALMAGILVTLGINAFRTSFNRRALAFVGTLVVVNGTARFLQGQLGQDLAVMNQVEGTTHWMAACIVTFVLSIQLWPLVPIYFGAFVVAYLSPENYGLAEGIAHVSFAIFMGLLWNPAKHEPDLSAS